MLLQLLGCSPKIVFIGNVKPNDPILSLVSPASIALAQALSSKQSCSIMHLILEGWNIKDFRGNLKARTGATSGKTKSCPAHQT
jgi:hypothetical protein